MKIIDGHAHIFPDNIAEAALNSLQGTSALQAPYGGSLDSLCLAMEQNGVDMALNLPVATRPEQVEPINRYSHNLPPNIIPFAAFHPGVTDLYGTLKNIKDGGYSGVKIHPEYQYFNWDSEVMHKVCSFAQELDIILFTHSGWDVSFENIRSPVEEFASVAMNYPRLRFVAAHFGGYLSWDKVEKHLVGMENVYFDTSFTLPYLDPARMKTMTYAHGLEKVFFGTDFPWQPYEKEFYYLSSIFSSSELERIYSANIISLLGLS